MANGASSTARVDYVFHTRCGRKGCFNRTPTPPHGTSTYGSTVPDCLYSTIVRLSHSGAFHFHPPPSLECTAPQRRQSDQHGQPPACFSADATMPPRWDLRPATSTNQGESGHEWLWRPRLEILTATLFSRLKQDSTAFWEKRREPLDSCGERITSSRKSTPLAQRCLAHNLSILIDTRRCILGFDNRPASEPTAPNEIERSMDFPMRTDDVVLGCELPSSLGRLVHAYTDSRVPLRNHFVRN